jgi:anti-sigma-K factor RskA
MTNHEELKSLIAPYVLGAVPSDEEPMVRTHLVSCDECRAEAESYGEVTRRLALAVEPSALPKGFADRVIGEIHRDRPKHAAPSRSTRLLPVLGFAILALVTATLAFFLVTARNDVSEERQLVAALLEDEGGMRLSGEDAVAAMVPTDDGAVFVVEGLPDAPADKTYQLWLLDENQDPVSVGTFDADDGRAVLTTDRSIEGFSGAAVTVEPAGGSPAPTSDPVLAPSTA